MQIEKEQSKVVFLFDVLIFGRIRANKNLNAKEQKKNRNIIKQNPKPDRYK